MIPPLDPEPWPTLGPEICDFIEDHLVHGPGDVLGQPVTLTAEQRRFIYRAYEVYPRGHRRAGRRRFKRVVLSRRKGWAKSEVAAWVAIAESHPEAPVRCDGWRKHGRSTWVPVGRAIHDPYIPLVAVTEEQSEDLVYGAVLEILLRCELGAGYYLGVEEIHHRSAPGVMKPMASAPSAREGARTSFQAFDETHLFTQVRLRRAHSTMLRNVPKRFAADAWSLETTTMYEPGAGSVAEESHHYALAVERGEFADPDLLFDHVQAGDHHDLSTKRGRRAALREASGDAWSYTDVESVLAQYDDPQVGPRAWARYWLNRPTDREERWLDVERWAELASPGTGPGEDEAVVLAFVGDYRRSSTALVGCTVEGSHAFVVQTWEAPERDLAWRTPSGDVDAAVARAMEAYRVVELAPNPTGWHREVEEWEATYGEVVGRFNVASPARFGPACDSFVQALADGALTHDGSEVLERHLAACVPQKVRGYDVVTAYGDERIEAAKAAIVAQHRAHWYATHASEEEGEFVAFTV